MRIHPYIILRDWQQISDIAFHKDQGFNTILPGNEVDGMLPGPPCRHPDPDIALQPLSCSTEQECHD